VVAAGMAGSAVSARGASSTLLRIESR
jgi:hypothetical protein